MTEDRRDWDGDLAIDPDLPRATTPPGRLYTDPALFERVRERVFARSWQLIGDAAEVAEAGAVRPVTLLPGCLDEPLVLTRGDDGRLRCLSNVCTHRAFPVVSEPCRASALRCRYHGRRFALDGRLLSAPEFEGCAGFPAASDDLPAVALEGLDRLLFASLDPIAPWREVIAPVRERLDWVPWSSLRLDPGASRSYEVAANWALYVDNYLEGFHIPFVHPALARSLDWKAYRILTFPHAVLQVGVAGPSDPCFALPQGHPDAGLRVAAFYWWLFPNTMLNLYPWGLSINVVEPLAVDRTRIRYLTYVGDEERRGEGAGGDLHQVELEDEAVVEAQQRAMRARLYRRGRYSPRQEAGVHRFHRLLVATLRGEAPPPD